MAPIFRKIISAGLSPNTEGDDVWAATKQLCSPWQWKKGAAVERVEHWFRNYTKSDSVRSFNSGRSALLALLKAFDVHSGDEVIVQAFTCVAVPNSVVWCGAEPVYADIDDRLNIDPESLSKRITKRTKGIIVQHTFGIAADMTAIGAIAKKHNLFVIEDCAHALGGSYKGKKLGTLGDAAFFSFGRDKVVSSVWGGVAVIHPKTGSKTQVAKLDTYHASLSVPSYTWIGQQLLHPISSSVILPLYNSGIGKVLLVLLQKIHLLSLPVQRMELQGKQPKEFPLRYPNALAQLLLVQLAKLDRYTSTRKNIVAQYAMALQGKNIPSIPNIEDSSLLRFPLLIENREEVVQRAKAQGIHIGNWYSNVIDPKNTDLATVRYGCGSCPNAERIARQIINLPTRITLVEARRVCDVLRAH